MSRSGRRILLEYPYHITHRGNNKQQLFFCEEDYRNYLYWLEEVSRKYEFNILAFCLMPNHVHFIAKAGHKDSFAQTIKMLHARYARHFHSKNDSVGHVWQGRYYSCLLEEGHLYRAIRYVERNPVRAQLIYKPWDWSWSSARAHTLNEKGIVTLMDHKAMLNIVSWKDYINEIDQIEDLEEIRCQTNANKSWGSVNFKKRMLLEHNIDLAIRIGGRPKKKT